MHQLEHVNALHLKLVDQASPTGSKGQAEVWGRIPVTVKKNRGINPGDEQQVYLL